MAHNNIKVGTGEPNRAGEITPSLDLNDLGDVSGTPSNNDILQYSGGAWAPASVSGSSVMQYIFFGHGESQAYSDSPATTLNANDTLYLYDTGSVNEITGASLSTTASGSGTGVWLNSVTLPAGTYRATLTCHPSFSTSGYFAFALFDGGSTVTSTGTVGALTDDYSSGGPIATGSFVLGSSRTLNCEVVSVSGVDTVANQGNDIAETATLLIEKMA